MEQVSPAKLKTLVAAQSVHLLDVREDVERAAENLGGQWIPLGELGQRWREIPTDKPILVYCKKGVRSVIAIQKLSPRMPAATWLNLQGGMEAWKNSLT